MKIAIGKKTLLALAAASTLAVAAPAMAQNYEAEYYGYGENHPYDVWGRDIEQRQRALEQQVRRAGQSGQIGQRQMRTLTFHFDQLNRVKAQYRRGGYTRAEVNDINTRMEQIQAQLRYGGRGGRGRDRWDDRGGYGRDRGYGSDYGRDRYDD